MSKIIDIKKDQEFYSSFSSLIEVLKAIAISQFHSLEKSIKTFEKFTEILEGFFDLLNVGAIPHTFVNPGNMPSGIIAVTSDTGLLGGLNHRIMTAAVNYIKSKNDKLIVIGLQGQFFTRGLNVNIKIFPGINEENREELALRVRNYVVEEALSGRLGYVKLIYPYAVSIAIQHIVELDVLPCTKWTRFSKNKPIGHPDVLLESTPEDIIEYLVYLWIGQKLYEVFQLSSLAEFAARVIHLEESSQKIKEVEKKLKLQYFHARHEIIDQQMRELFSARV